MYNEGVVASTQQSSQDQRLPVQTSVFVSNLLFGFRIQRESKLALLVLIHSIKTVEIKTVQYVGHTDFWLLVKDNRVVQY